MIARSSKPLLTFGLLASLVSATAGAEEVRVAVAANFLRVMERIAGEFEAETGHETVLASGSTGKHYAQILNGAPFDLFFAADGERPTLLERKGAAVGGSRFTYAIGRLVLWGPRPDLASAGDAVLAGGDFRYLAIANPKLAPYGRAARETLEGLGLWERLSPRIVRGENVTQALAFVQSFNAELGFVAYSQVKELVSAGRGSLWLVPDSLHSPIEQQAVLLAESEAARELVAFVRGERARTIIRESGYEVP